MIEKWVIPNFALIMSESVAENDFHQKNSLSMMSFFVNPGWVKWHPLKQTKLKNKHHFYTPTFWVIQLYFLVRKDSSTPKVWKIHVRYPGRFTNRNQYMTGTFVYIQKGLFPKLFQKWLENEMPVALQKSEKLDFRHDILST